jgi:membrane protein DedA with SNARE-associated domain
MRWSRFLVANAAGGLLWAGVYAFGAYALGSAASSVGSTITIVGYVVAGVLTVATIVERDCLCGSLSNEPRLLSRRSKRGV